MMLVHDVDIILHIRLQMRYHRARERGRSETEISFLKLLPAERLLGE